jgi:membrane fusion protein, macrolide-specific efflux system
MDRLRRNLRRPWVVMPAVAVVALGGWFAVRPDDEPTSTLPTSRTVDVTRGTLARTVSAQGTVAAAESEDLSFSSAGTVTAVSVKAGDQVTTGQVLATMDATELESDVAEAEADLAEAKAAQSDHAAAGASAAQKAADASNVTSAQDRLDQAEEALAGAQLVAPFDGTIAAVEITVGEELTSSGDGSVTPTGSDSGSGLTGPSLGDDGTGSGSDIQIISTGRYQVDLGVDDSDIESIAAGQPIEVTLSTASSSTGAFPGGFAPPGAVVFGEPGGFSSGPVTQTDDGDGGTKTPTVSGDAASATGTVTEVGTLADASSGVASYPVTVDFTDDSGDFNVGATVLVEITIEEVEDVLQVPVMAVTDDGDGSTVTVTKDGKEEERAVTTGFSSGGMIEIKSGLEEGEQVVISFGIPEGLTLDGDTPARLGGGG